MLNVHLIQVTQKTYKILSSKIFKAMLNPKDQVLITCLEKLEIKCLISLAN